MKNLFFKCLVFTLFYICTMLTIALLFGNHAFEITKWPVCILFVLYDIFRPFKKKKEEISKTDQRLLEELQKAKENSVDIVPVDETEFLEWLNAENEDNKKLMKDVKFELAPQEETDKRDREIRILLTYLLEDEDKEIADDALITDESCIFDFFFDPVAEVAAIKKLNIILGKDVGIEPEDYLWVAIDKIKKEFPNWPDLKLVVNN